jgi:hypothetical protein
MGKPKTPTEIASMARAYTDTVLKAFAGIVMREDAPPASRIAAGLALLDRGWGKPTQNVNLSNDQPVVDEIVNHIIDPKTHKILRQVVERIGPNGRQVFTLPPPGASGPVLEGYPRESTPDTEADSEPEPEDDLDPQD